jgi:hypothetical protein
MTPIDELKIFSGAGGSLHDAVKILAAASIKEINYVLDKIDYYLEHINVISNSNGISKNELQIKTKKEFLQNLHKILLNELQRRNSLSGIN